MTLPDAAHAATLPPKGQPSQGAPALPEQTTGAPADHRLDLRGLHCPMPVLRTRKALRHIGIGAALMVECTDPLTAIDIPHFVAEAGHELAVTYRDGELFTYRIVRRR